MHCLQSVFGDVIISRGLWPPYFPDLNMCDCYLRVMLKDKVYSNTHCTEDGLERKKTFRMPCLQFPQHNLGVL
jgi:hypothetical protein